MVSSSRLFSTKLTSSLVARVAACASSLIKLSIRTLGSAPASPASATSPMASMCDRLSAIAVVRNCFAEFITECSCCDVLCAAASSAPCDPT